MTGVDYRWKNQSAYTYASLLSKRFGNPTNYTYQNDSRVVGVSWDRQAMSETPLWKLEVCDEVFETGGIRVDRFVIATVKYNITGKCNPCAVNVTDMTGYDGTHRVMWARGATLEQCIAVLMVATAVGNCVLRERIATEKSLIVKALEKSVASKVLFSKQLETNLAEQPEFPSVSRLFEMLS